MATQPLHGLRVVVTRERHESEEMARRLVELGAKPIVIPAIEIVPHERESLDMALSSLDMFDWVVFTSANAVRVVFDRFSELGIAPAELSRRSKVASIGEKTSGVLREQGVEIALQPDEANAESLVRALAGQGLEGWLALLPTSRIARPTLANGLRQAGAQIVTIAVYDTVAPESAPRDALNAVRGGEADVVTFTSPSTVENFVKLTGVRDLPAICIGATTAEAARSAGFDVAAVAVEQSVEGLIEALVDFRESSKARERPMMENGTSFRRFRRFRQTEGLRRLVRETRLDPEDFIYPLFVTYGRAVRREVPSMPEVYQISVDRLGEEIEELRGLGIGSVILFGIPEHKDAEGSGAYDPDGIIQQAAREIKRLDPEMTVIGDVCLCEYTDHGHCGLLDGERILNDETLELLGRTAVTQVAAGVDVVAPSDMMDGRVAAIRSALDREGFIHAPIIAYAAKYASAFYGPFRDAAESTPQFGDRRSHQMDPGNAREAYAEIATDIAEGADAIMVKPALSYLDVIAGARERFDVPVFAYNVSGEYSLVKAAGRLGWVDERRMTLEILTSIKRAGADRILSYHAKQVARWIQEDREAQTRLVSPVG